MCPEKKWRINRRLYFLGGLALKGVFFMSLSNLDDNSSQRAALPSDSQIQAIPRAGQLNVFGAPAFQPQTATRFASFAAARIAVMVQGPRAVRSILEIGRW